uniref:SXP/RAL-2 family protein Ani s 5-like cation-binding domain-containing protein n=1 Tax=Strongyloides stercoralis TaxID=6248 RepID=A0A0K0ESF5_STRER
MKFILVNFILLSIFFMQFVDSFPPVSPEEENNWRIIDAVSDTTKLAAQGLSDKAIDTLKLWSSSFGEWIGNAKNNVQVGLNYIANDINHTKQKIVSKVNNFSNVAEVKYDEVKNSLKDIATKAEKIKDDAKKKLESF